MNTKSNIFAILKIVLLFSLFVSLSACEKAKNISLETTPTVPTEIVYPQKGSGSYITARTIEELVRKSTIIVTGEFIAKKQVINMARDSNDINKPDSNILGVGQVYEFEVKEYIKGDGPDVIYVVQPEGFLVGKEKGINYNEEDIVQAKTLIDYVSIKLNNPYVLLLEPLLGFPELKSYFTVPIHPWRFDISNPDYAVPESPWDEAINVFPPRKASRLMEQIENPELADDYPKADYPPPGQTPYP